MWFDCVPEKKPCTWKKSVFWLKSFTQIKLFLFQIILDKDDVFSLKKN